MVPAFPLDGGRILRSVLWQLTGNLRRATRWAAGVGRLFGWLLIGWGAWMFLFMGARLAGAWAAFLGWFLAGAATSAVRRHRVHGMRESLSGYPVSAALASGQRAVSAAASVEELIRESLLVRPGDARLVVRNGRPVGAVTLAAAAAVPEEERPEVPVFEIMTPLAELPRFRADHSLAEAAVSLSRRRERPVLVGAPDGTLGVLTMSDVDRWIERWETLDG
jgi:hypothetical protein